MINAGTNPIETKDKTKTASAGVAANTTGATPSFPTYNPAQQNKSFINSSSMPPAGVQPTSRVTPPTASTPPVSTPVGQPAPAPAKTMPPINKPASNAPVVPAKPKFPDPTQTNLVKADGTTSTAAINKSAENSVNDGSNKKKKPKNKLGFKKALGIIVLLVIILGSGVGFYLTQQSQDLRQQADEPVCTAEAGSCIGTDGISCVPFTNGCEKTELCEDPLTTCEIGEVCTAEAGSCIGTDGISCVAFTDGCEKTELCEDPLTTCEEDAADPIACNDPCTKDSACSDVNPDWFCSFEPANSFLGACRLQSDPTSATCEEAEVCTAEAGSCIGTDGISCVAFTDGCEKTELCEDPLTTCEEVAETCTDLTTLDSCNAAASPECAWFACNNTCQGTDTTLEEAGCDLECAELYCEDGTTPGKLCDAECTVDSQCSNTDPDWSCDVTSNTCRLDSNPTSITCEIADNDVDDNDDDILNVCNDICVTNSDCANSNQICVTTSDGSNRCRLESYTSSTTCTISGSSDTQPDLPEELLETGPEDWLNWLKAGLMTLGIGTALFLLL